MGAQCASVRRWSDRSHASSPHSQQLAGALLEGLSPDPRDDRSEQISRFLQSLRSGSATPAFSPCPRTPFLTRKDCINSTRLDLRDISNSFVERPLWAMGRVIRSRHNVRIQILAEIQLFSERLGQHALQPVAPSLSSFLVQSFKAVAMPAVLSLCDGWHPICVLENQRPSLTCSHSEMPS